MRGENARLLLQTLTIRRQTLAGGVCRMTTQKLVEFRVPLDFTFCSARFHF